MSQGSARHDRGRQRDRLVRSIAQSQLVTSAVVLLLAVLALTTAPESLVNPLFYTGLAIMFVVTGLAVIVPWTVNNKHWAVALPILDIIAIVVIREGTPQSGVVLFLAFPVIWMARNFRLSGAICSVALATFLLWSSWLLGGEALASSDVNDLILLPITLAFIATTTYATSRRTTGQRILLRSQAAVTETAFARARAQERTLEEILDAVEFGVVAFDRNGEVTVVNEAHRRSLSEFGAPRTALVHPVAYQYDRVTKYPEASRPFSRALSGQEFENMTLWVGEPGDDRVAFSVTARRLTTPDGDIDGGVVVLRDVTAELEAIQARDNLIASVSHELRTPLTSILGYLELALDDEALTPETSRMIDIAHRNSERLLSLVTDLLLAASDADKTLPLTLVTCNVAQVAENALEDQKAVADTAGIELVSEITTPAITNADPLRIRQVMDNLLSNAIKYNRPGGAVTLSVRLVPNGISVSVADTGVGLTDDEQAQLFDKFYRTESARQSTVSGSGLGMGITRDIVRQHGGELGVVSAVGVGTTFTMLLPAMERVSE
jgi:two-component system phosphate regulon sensor histidine kinase PhoR